MRVLFSTLTAPGHLFPMIPFAHALAAYGHRVRVACSPAFARIVSETGVVAAPAGADVDFAGIWSTESTPGETPRMRSARMFDTAAMMTTPALVAAARDWDADLIVFEPRSFAGPIAARATGIPSVRHCWAADSRYLRTTPSAQLKSWTEATFGVTLDDLHGDATIEPAPQVLRGDSLPGAAGMRYIPFTTGFRDEVVEPRRPIVVAWSGTFVRARQTLDPLRTVLRGLAGRADEVVLLIADEHARLLGARPDGIRVASGVSLESQLPHTRLLIHTGNGGPMMSAVAHGVPQLIYSAIGDSAINGASMADAGVGRTRTCDDISDETVTADVEEILDSAGVAEAARSLALANAQEMSPLDRAATLADLI